MLSPKLLLQAKPLSVWFEIRGIIHFPNVSVYTVVLIIIIITVFSFNFGFFLSFKAKKPVWKPRQSDTVLARAFLFRNPGNGFPFNESIMSIKDGQNHSDGVIFSLPQVCRYAAFQKISETVTKRLFNSEDHFQKILETVTKRLFNSFHYHHILPCTIPLFNSYHQTLLQLLSPSPPYSLLHNHAT